MSGSCLQSRCGWRHTCSSGRLHIGWGDIWHAPGRRSASRRSARVAFVQDSLSLSCEHHLRQRKRIRARIGARTCAWSDAAHACIWALQGAADPDVSLLQQRELLSCLPGAVCDPPHTLTACSAPDLGIVGGGDEEGAAVTLVPGHQVHNPVQGRPEAPVGPLLQHVPQVHDEGVGQLRDVQPGP